MDGGLLAMLQVLWGFLINMFPLIGKIPGALKEKLEQPLFDLDIFSICDHDYIRLAKITKDGFFTTRNAVNEQLTSKEYATKIYPHFLRLEEGRDFNNGRAAQIISINNTPIVIIGERTLDLQVENGMSSFDQWVFHHLQDMWKNRK